MVCAFVDHHRRFALAFVNGPRPAEDSHELQPIERGRPVMAALDLEPAHRLAMAVCGQSVELAGAAIGAVAVDELTPLDCPLCVRHGRPLTGMLGEAERTQAMSNSMLPSQRLVRKHAGEAACIARPSMPLLLCRTSPPRHNRS